MPIRFLFRFLSHFTNNEQIVARLAESRPIRRSAQLVAYLYHRSNDLIRSGAIQQQLNPVRNRMLTFKNRFVTEFREEMQNAKDKLKKP